MNPKGWSSSSQSLIRSMKFGFKIPRALSRTTLKGLVPINT